MGLCPSDQVGEKGMIGLKNPGAFQCHSFYDLTSLKYCFFTGLIINKEAAGEELGENIVHSILVILPEIL